MEKRERSCGAVILRKGEQHTEVLLIRHNLGHWGFPKGHTEPGETDEMTAVREVKEETGYDIRLRDGFIDSTRYSPKEGVMKDVIYFIGEVCGGSPKAQESEVSELRWVRPIDAFSLLTFDNDVLLFRNVLKYLKTFDGGEE